jgi:acyl-coenzyme A synthetase/AMP-(fatty) acid ligase
MPDGVSAVAAYLGCLLYGGIAAFLNNRLRTDDYAECISAMQPSLMITTQGHEAFDAAQAAGLSAICLDDDMLELLFQDARPLDPFPSRGDEVCTYFVTSGTTGHPKIVPHTHDHMFAVAQSMGEFSGCRQDDIVLCNSKISHTYGSFASISVPLQVGATTVLDPGKPSPAETLRLLETERVTVFWSVPALYAMLLMHMADADFPSAIRLCLSAGESLPQAVSAQWRAKTGLTIYQGYGSTENMTYVIGRREEQLAPDCAGTVVPPYEAMIFDAALAPVAVGEPGQLGIRGPSVMSGYINEPEWSRKLFAPGGYMLTGDMAVEHDGVFTILGRADDMFKVGGLWASPLRVEAALMEHPAVSMCAVTAGAVSAFTLVRAHIVLAPGFGETDQLKNELRGHALSLLPDYMAPTEFMFHSALPLTVSGKVQRYKLRRLEADEASPADAALTKIKEAYDGDS